MANIKEICEKKGAETTGNMNPLDALFYGAIGIAKCIAEESYDSTDYSTRDTGTDRVIKTGAKMYDGISKKADEIRAKRGY